MGDGCSAKLDVKSGVTQGSVLELLLFLLFLNNLTSALKSPSYFFVDGVEMEGFTGREYFSNDIGVVLDRANKWDLPLNASKSQSLPRSLKSLMISLFTVNAVTSVKDPRDNRPVLNGRANLPQ